MKFTEPGTHEEHVQRVLAIMHRDAMQTFRHCGGEMKDIPFVEEPWQMAQKLLEDHNER